MTRSRWPLSKDNIDSKYISIKYEYDSIPLIKEYVQMCDESFWNRYLLNRKIKISCALAGTVVQITLDMARGRWSFSEDNIQNSQCTRHRNSSLFSTGAS